MNRSAIQIKYNDTGTGLFKDNTTNAIIEDFLRQFVADMSNNALTIDDNKYNGVKGTSPGINTIAGLKAIVTVNNGITPVGTCISYRDTDDNVFRFCELVAGIDAESLPDVVRPSDFNATTNQKVWKTAPAGAALGDGNGTTFTGTAIDIGGVLTDTLLTGPNGISMEFGTSGGGVLGFDWAADQMLLTSDQWFAISSDGNLTIGFDVDTQDIVLQTTGGTVRISATDIDFGGLPVINYYTSAQVNSQISISETSQKFKHDKLHARTTAALPANTVGGSNTTLTGNANGALPAQDGITLSVGQALGVFDEATQTKRGVYLVTQVGSGILPYILTRRSDSDTGPELECAIYQVEQGTRFAGTSWKQITPSPTLGSSNIVFKPFGDNIIEDAVSGYYKIISTSGVLSTTSV